MNESFWFQTIVEVEKEVTSKNIEEEKEKSTYLLNTETSNFDVIRHRRRSPVTVQVPNFNDKWRLIQKAIPFFHYRPIFSFSVKCTSFSYSRHQIGNFLIVGMGCIITTSTSAVAKTIDRKWGWWRKPKNTRRKVRKAIWNIPVWTRNCCRHKQRNIIAIFSHFGFVWTT
jgi:hypothetical protein